MNIQNEDFNLYKDYESRVEQYKRELEKAIEQDPNSINTKIYYQLKNVQTALGLTDEAVSVAYTSLGNDLKQQGYPKTDVISIFEEAIRINCKVAAAYTALGTILYKQGQKKEGITKLETARSLFMEQGMIAEADRIQQLIEELHKSNNFLSHITRFLISSRETPQPIDDRRSDDEMSRRVARLEKRPNKVYHQGDIVSEKSNYTFNNSKFGGGFAGTGGTQSGGTLYDYSSNPSLTKAAAEIQQLLQQLEATNPTTTSVNKRAVVNQAIEAIENNPALKATVIAALNASGPESLKGAINHPLAKNIMPFIEELAD
jgi:tetratricopeptide (TPR) repeat protein